MMMGAVMMIEAIKTEVSETDLEKLGQKYSGHLEQHVKLMLLSFWILMN